MNYAVIKKHDIANGEGVRVSIWVSGCPIHCEGCFNKDLWDFNYGEKFAQDTIDEILEALKPDYISGLSILGGEPLAKDNLYEVENLLQAVREKFGTSKSIWLYTGFKYEAIANLYLTKYLDVIVDGPFVEEERDISLRFKGSKNQRIINMGEGTGYDKSKL